MFNLYSIYDEGAQAYGPVFQAVNRAVAIRNTVHFLEKVKPYDRSSFSLIELGTFHEETGEIVSNIQAVNFDMPSFEDVSPRKFAFEEDGNV